MAAAGAAPAAMQRKLLCDVIVERPGGGTTDHIAYFTVDFTSPPGTLEASYPLFLGRLHEIERGEHFTVGFYEPLGTHS
jgi:hypothetical protein